MTGPATDQPYPVLRRIGEDGLLVEFADSLSDAANAAAIAFRAEVDVARLAGVVETASALKSVWLRFDPDEIGHAALEDDVRELLAARDWLTAPLPAGRRRWRIPAVFGGDLGPQLEEVADLVGMSPDATVETLCDTPLRVLAMGFAPGMPYLGILPDRWDIPRQSELTPRVPAGALVVAVRQVVAFTVSAQTGWRWVGQAAFTAFDPARDPPFLFRPGDEVAFFPVASDELARAHGNHNLPDAEVIS